MRNYQWRAQCGQTIHFAGVSHYVGIVRRITHYANHFRVVRISSDHHIAPLLGGTLGQMLHAGNKGTGGVNNFGGAAFEFELLLGCHSVGSNHGDRVATERKQYLDAQAADLTEAMATLESAIRQIDRESRELLQQTFDAVNVNFGKLFPTLFGGGHAKLVLTGEEILDSGIQVVAQPPGKRNTSIHLLSGGEKALTATSLVFALFQLNPAPFCLLDEVDAPLDDSNTERFCSMVAEMAQVTQFLFISHNKITMEMAHQLIGITMPEPGVSRVVAVDIAEAVELAGSQARAKAAA